MTAAADAQKSADATKATVDHVTATANTAFKDGVEKTLAALAEANTHSKKNLEAVAASVSAAAKGAEALSAQAVAFSKSALETQVNAAKTLAAAKTPQEVVELQTAFAKSTFETCIGEFGRMSETFAVSFKECLKPLNERVNDMVGSFQPAR
jgi:phasin family protein